MIEGDVMLQGQGTDAQSLVPVMGVPNSVDGEMKFEDWLTRILPTGKGIKIDIQSTDAIEITLQTLKTHKEMVCVIECQERHWKSGVGSYSVLKCYLHSYGLWVNALYL